MPDTKKETTTTIDWWCHLCGKNDSIVLPIDANASEIMAGVRKAHREASTRQCESICPDYRRRQFE